MTAQLKILCQKLRGLMEKADLRNEIIATAKEMGADEATAESIYEFIYREISFGSPKTRTKKQKKERAKNKVRKASRKRNRK